jgi:hypothetical protein
MWEPQRLTTLWAFMACYRDNFTLQEVRWDRGGTERAGDYTFFYEKGNVNHPLATGFFMHKRIISAVMRAEFLSDKMLYRILRGHCCDIMF